MNSLDKLVTLTFSQAGKLILSVKNETASVRTMFQGLECDYEEDPSNTETTDSQVTVALKLREILSVFQFSNFLPVAKCEKILLCAVKSQSCVVFVSFGRHEGCMTYYIPVLLINDA